MMWQICCYCTVLVAIIAFLIPAFPGVVKMLKTWVTKEYIERELLIIVLSARGNFKQRQAVRDTWFGNVKRDPLLDKRVFTKFLIGSETCDLPVDDRKDPLGCELWDINTVPSKEIYAQSVLFFDEKDVNEYLEDGGDSFIILPSLNFKVLFPIVVNKLGVLANVYNQSKNVTVKILDSVTQEIIIETEFLNDTQYEEEGGFLYIEVNPFVFPKGYEATVYTESISEDGKISKAPFLGKLNQENLISFTMGSDGPLLPYANQEYLSGVSFGFTVHQPEVLAVHIKNRNRRIRRWQDQIDVESDKLKDEGKTYHDILFVRGVDTYQSIPRKLLEFYKWVGRIGFGGYIVKTDDDCFLDVRAILQKLPDYHNTSSVWWSSFRTDWPVQKHGKWMEKNYKASIYPPFACGSGYLTGPRLNYWLYKNAWDLMSRYQGEDTSMGIWLSAIGANMVNDPRWQCLKTCESNMISMPELNPEELRKIWQNKVLCGNPCKSCAKADATVP